jgi:hypothetical protein
MSDLTALLWLALILDKREVVTMGQELLRKELSSLSPTEGQA